MKILHIITGLNNGGAEAILFRNVVYDQKNTHIIISLMDLGYFGEPMKKAGISVYVLNIHRGKLSFKGLIELYRLIKEIRPDIIQTWMYHADLLGSVIAKICGVKSIVWGVHHSNLSPRLNKLTTRIVALVCARLSFWIPNKIICCSESAAKEHIRLGYKSNKIVIVSNGVDISLFKPDALLRQKIRKDLKIRTEEVLLGMVARWDSLKDHANLITALGLLSKIEIKQWKCILVGPGITEKNNDLVELLIKNNILDCVQLLDARSDIPSIMNALDIHVLPSSGESFGNVTIEAMACGVPAIVTNVGSGELIVGKTGWVVPSSNAKELLDAILLAIGEMDNSDSWAIRQSACRAKVIQQFSIEHMVNNYCKVWKSVLMTSES